MLFELIEYDYEQKSELNISKYFLSIKSFKSILYFDQKLNLTLKKVLELKNNGYKFDFELIREISTKELKKQFSIIIPNKCNYLLLETEGNNIFKSQLLQILNTNFNDFLRFFPFQFSFEQEWRILNNFDYMLLKLITENGIQDEEKVEHKEKYPIYSSTMKVKINEKVFPIILFLKGFEFSPRMTEKDIFLFLSKIKDVLV